jgi:predicted dehydrogenase
MTEETKDASQNSRRDFIKQSAVAAAAIMIVPRHVLGGNGFRAPSDMLTVASVGCGGKGQSDIAMFAKSGKANIAYLCDVDDKQAATTFKNFPNAKRYKDWREMFDKESKNFDAVSVSTPDHTHAVVAYNAMARGKHVYVQKPMTHDLWEARTLTDAAKRFKVVTQMGNQGSSNDGTRLMSEW